MNKEEIKVGTKISFNFDNYDIYYNTDYVYLGSEIKEGIVMEFDDNKEDNRLKNEGLIKVGVMENRYGENKLYPYYIKKEDIIEKKIIRIKDKLRDLRNSIMQTINHHGYGVGSSDVSNLLKELSEYYDD